MKKVFLIAVFVLSTVRGFYIKNKEPEVSQTSSHSSQNEFEDKFAHITKSWLNYKRKLQSIPRLDSSDFNQEKDRFNELEVLELIPSVIDHYRAGEVTQDEENLLSELYGNFWSLIVHEAKRKPTEKMNQILQSLFESLYLIKGIMNDIEQNTVHRISKKIAKPHNKLFLRFNNEDHPSQRVLNTAAMLIHYARNIENNNENSDVKLKKSKEINPRTISINLQLKNIPIGKIRTQKRSIDVHSTDKDLITSKVNEILSMYGKKYYSADDDEQGAENDDYEDEKNDVQDYYEGNYEDDEKDAYPISDSEYGDFRELVYLSAIHGLKRQQEELKLKASRRNKF